jgi:hypothetical protein
MGSIVLPLQEWLHDVVVEVVGSELTKTAHTQILMSGQ